MKNTLIAAAALAVLAGSGCLYAVASNRLGGKSIKGSGNITERTLPAPDFHGVDASRAIKVVITDKTSDIRIEADDNLMNLVQVAEHKGILEVTLDRKVNNVSDSHITVTVPYNARIRSLEASSASKIIGEVLFTANDFLLDASSAAEIEAAVKAAKCRMEASSASEIEANVQAGEYQISTSSAAKIKATLKGGNCTAKASSASKIALDGTVERLDADLNSAAKLNAAKLTAVDAVIETSSGSSASVDCSGKLTASASSGSSIRYTGDCSTSLSKSSGGSIHRK